MTTLAMYELDRICAENTGFRDFADLLASHHSYRPSCDMREEWAVTLADGFDAAMKERGDERRAYRYGATQYEPGRATKVYCNQGKRNAVVLAVLNGYALVEYEMPAGTTGLRVLRGVAGEYGKTLTYRSLPSRWVRAIREQGSAGLMIGNGQSRETWAVPAEGDKLVDARRAPAAVETR